MCGRFTQRKKPAEVVEYYSVSEESFEIAPRYNIAPMQMIAAMTMTRQLVGLKWGLIPSWAKDPKIANNLINARGETIHEKPSFRAALSKRRCLIPADGWYEWKKQDGVSQPYFFHRRDEGLFSFAGLWEEWRSPEGKIIKTCTIITTEPNELAAQYHHRMPAILKRSDESFWLDQGSRIPDLLQILAPYPDDDLGVHPVSRSVNSVANDDPSLALRIE